jgi:hypothetical protein
MQLVRYEGTRRPRRLVLALYIKTQLYSTKTLADWLAYPSRVISSQDVWTNAVIRFFFAFDLVYFARLVILVTDRIL